MHVEVVDAEEPSAQVEHTEAPVERDTVPALHCLQSSEETDPVMVMKEPVGQAWQ